ncbi:carbohydrate ABC transporter permease [Mycobacterium sp. pW049]|uniref:carbohydrate ABC transporter permease n=1 Tax=[Mycobacterium] bulgaricum TaxID=3238985 RepID=UPI00351B2681
MLLPVGIVAVLSLYEYDLLAGTSHFDGWGNYEAVLRGSELQQAVARTVLYALLTVPTIVVVGLVLALGVNSLARGAAVWRTAYFVPAASTLAAMSVVWTWLFYPVDGVIDATVGAVAGWQGWLNSTQLAMPAVAVVGSWQGIGAAMVMFLAGLNNVNPDLVDAARLDRAGSWQRFWHVTFPALGPALVFAVVVATGDALRVFDQIQVMTGGGPARATTTLSYLMWERAITFSDIGGGAVISLVLLALVLIVTFAQLCSFGRRWEEAGRR